MRILGIDPGLTRCGVGVVNLREPRQLEFEHVEVIRSSADQALPERIALLGTSIERLLDGEKIDALALERVFAQQNLPSVMGVAQISGVIMFLAAKRNIPVTLYTPNEVKAQVTGYGAANKTQVTSMVMKHLRLQQPPKPADAADALALAITHAWSMRMLRKHTNESSTQTSVTSLTPAQQAWLVAEKHGRRRR